MTAADKVLLNNVLAGDSLSASEQACRTGKIVPFPLHEWRAHRPAALLARIEAEVIELFRRHMAALSRYASTITRDRMIVEDGIQEAFLRYFISRTGGRQLANPRAWLFRVLRNYILDRHRKSNSMTAVDLEAAGQLADLRQDVEARYEESETFRHALSSLSPRELECMQLRLGGLAYDEIAQALRIRTGTVGALLTRGLRKIRKTDLLSRKQRCLGKSPGE